MSTGDREAGAAAVLRECDRTLAARRGTIVGEATGGNPDGVVDWRHYPAGEIYDALTHVQYFYHRHPSGPADEAGGGHFHVFLRGEGVPAGVRPLMLAEHAVANAPLPPQSAPLKRGSRDEVCHLVAIAVDGRGRPIRLFTTNRWVTGETWFRADDAIRLLDRVRLRRLQPPALLDRWIEALIRLFQPEIAVLLRRRDKAVIDWRWRWPRANVFEDPRLEITSSCDIDLDARLAAVEARAATPAAPAPGMRRLARPPAMAEGWGT